MKLLYGRLSRVFRWDRLVSRFLRALSEGRQLWIWQSKRRHPQPYWHGYDPATDEYVSYGSEAEIRRWIEQRYYSR